MIKLIYAILIPLLFLSSIITEQKVIQVDTTKKVIKQEVISYDLDGTLQLIQLGNGNVIAVCSGEKTDCAILDKKPTPKTEKATTDSLTTKVNNH